MRTQLSVLYGAKRMVMGTSQGKSYVGAKIAK